MSSDPKFPWRIDTNDRYRELVSAILSLSTAALLLPVFLAREFLGVPEQTPLKDTFTCTAYWGWACLSVSILACIVFYFFSAKWARLAWEQPIGVASIPVSEGFVERALEISLWLAIIGFLAGVLLTLLFLVGYVPGP
jgi:hypothetical protein